MVRSLTRCVRGLAVVVVLGGLVGVPSPASSATCRSIGQPHAGAGSAAAVDVTVVSSCLAWFVGNIGNASGGGPLIERWNETSWKTQQAPNPGDGGLAGVAAVSSSYVWAVGSFIVGAHSRALIERWNGTRWKVQPSPHPDPDDSLQDVSVNSATDAWAVGTANGGFALAEHWNGTAWKVVPTPDPPSGYGQSLSGVASISPTNAWAVGVQARTRTSPTRTLMEHWNGTSWRVVASPNPRAGLNTLFAVDADSAQDVWAVGEYSNGRTLRPLAFERT